MSDIMLVGPKFMLVGHFKSLLVGLPRIERYMSPPLQVNGIPYDRIPSTTPGAEPPRDARDSGSARSHSTHLETSSSERP